MQIVIESENVPTNLPYIWRRMGALIVQGAAVLLYLCVCHHASSSQLYTTVHRICTRFRRVYE